MAVVPRYVAQQGLEVARAPNLQLDGSIGRQLQQLGATGEDVAMRWMAREEQKERFAAEQGLIRLSNDLDGQDQADAPNMAADGTGWRDSRQKAWAVRRTAFLNTVPEALKEEFSERTQTLGESYLTRAAGTEMKALGASSLAGLDTATNNLLTRTSANPASRRASEETLTALINTAPGLSNAERARLLASVPGRFDEAAAIAMVDAGDYEGALDVSGSPAGYFDTLRSRESGGRDDARAGTSSATGRYQFLGETWDGVAKSPEGRAAGLKTRAESETDPRLDPDQQEAAIRIFTAGNGRALAAGGFQPTERNLYLAHFLGDVGAVKMLKAINTDADQSAAALFPDAAKANKAIFYDRAGNARSVEQVYRVATRRFSGKAPDMSNADLTKVASPDWGRQLQLRRAVASAIDGRERKVEAERAAADAAKKSELQSRLGVLSIQINDAKNAGDVEQLGKLRTEAEALGRDIGFDKVDTIVNSAGNALALAAAEMREADRIMSAPTGTLDPRRKEDRDGVDQAYRLVVQPQLGGKDVTPDIRRARETAFAQQMGIVPETMVSRVSAALTSGSPDQMLDAAQSVDQLVAANPNFASAFAEDTQRMAMMLNLSRQFGEPDKAVEKAQALLAVTPADREARRATLTADRGKEMGDPAGAYLRSQVDEADNWDVDDDLIPDTMMRAYNDLVEREYILTGNKEAAYRLAWRQIDAKWGVSAINGDEQVVPWAPEKFYGLPELSVEENADWQRAQAITDARGMQGDFVLEPTGSAPLEDRISVVLHPRVASGPDGRPVYALALSHEDGGMTYLIDPATDRPAVWTPDAARALEADDDAAAALVDLRQRVERVRRIRAGGAAPATDVFGRLGAGSAR